MADFNELIGFVGSFPFWPEVVTGLISIVVAWATAFFTSKNTVLKQYREKRLAAYDEAIAFLDEFRTRPEYALTDDFFSTALRLSNHLRVYGSNEVVSEFYSAMQPLRRRKKEHDAEIDSFTRENWASRAFYDEEGMPFDYVDECRINEEVFYSTLENMKKEKVMSDREVLDLIEPILSSIHKSISSGRG